jgi:aminobenzoyl-glutamate transport protein
MLERIERFGNRLPDPVFIFLGCMILAIIASVIAAATGWSAVNPVTGETLRAQSLLSQANIAKLFVEMPETLTGFPPLGLVLVVMLGAAVAERSGMFTTLLGLAVRGLPRRALTPAAFILGMLSHHASDAAYVVYIPLVALVYAQAGRHPLAGVAVSFAAVSGGFAGNAVPGQMDVLLLGITEPAARLVDPAFAMNPLGNWWFSIAILLVFTPIAWFVTDRIVEPRLGLWSAEAASDHMIAAPTPDIGKQERRALRRAGLAALAVIALFAALALWPGFSPLIDDNAEGPQQLKPFYQSLIAAFFLLFLASGWAYGAAAGTVRSHRDVVGMMGDGMRSMAPYIVIAFFAAHFVAVFRWSNIGPILAVQGAEWLQGLSLPQPALLVALVGLSSGFDFLIGSASAKWSAMAPVVVPMLMMLGISPEMTTAAYRMGDSVTNIISPLASNFPLILIICQRWNRNFGLGSVIATMLPYSIGFAIAGMVLVAGWVTLGIPVGPGAPAAYSVPMMPSAPRTRA